MSKFQDVKANEKVFKGSNYADDYRKGRPKHPESLMEAILNFLRQGFTGDFDLAIDVGCGPGESTEILQPHFHQVLGLDYSSQMVENALQHNEFDNVDYKVSTAESMPMIADGSVVLVTAGRAIQYFDFDRFFKECQRILKPGGVVAFYSSDHTRFVIPDDPAKAEKLNARFTALRQVDTAGFWEGQIGIKQRKYVDIHVPFEDKLEIRDTSICLKSKTTFADFLQLFKSVPAFLKFAQDKGQDAWNQVLASFTTDFLGILEVPKDANYSDIELETCHDYFVIMGRK